MNIGTPLLLALVALSVLNVLLSFAVVRSGYYTSAQAVAQVGIVWLLPVIGAILVGVFLRSQRLNSVSGEGADHGNWENVEAGSHAGHSPE